MQYRRWVKENFKLPREQLVSLSSSSDAGHADKRSIPQEIDLISTDDFPPLQTANSSSQKDRTVSKNLSIENSEIKTSTPGGRAGTLYSSVGAANTQKQLELPNATEDSSDGREKSRSSSPQHDVSANISAIKDKGTCPQDYSAVEENESKLKEDESKDLGNGELEDSPNEDFIDEFVLDPFVSWGDICDDGLADDDDDDDDDDEHRNKIEGKYGKTETSIGNGGPSAWSSDEGAIDSSKQPKRPTYLATGQSHFTPHNDRNSNGRRYSYSRRNRRPRSPCEGIGEQDLANARHARQMIISSPEKPIIKSDKWAKEETKHYVKDHKVFLFPKHFLLIIFG